MDERTWCPIAKAECQDGHIHIPDPLNIAKYKCPAWKDGKCSIFCLINDFVDKGFQNFATGFMNNDGND